MGAGVVPVAVAPDGGYRMLLGRERFMPQWKGSCRWSGFEGSRKDNESMERTAIREFVEESLGVVEDDVHQIVSDRSYWIRIVLKILNERRAERYHTTYVIPVSWDVNLPQRFLKTRMGLELVDRATQEWRYARPAVLGDEDMDVGPIEVLEGSVHVARRPRRDPSTSIIPAPWVMDEQGVQTATLVGDAAEGVIEWQRLRERVEDALIDHPGVSVRRCDRWGLLQGVTVIKDHLEKDKVRWWTEHELRQVLDGRGHMGTDRFRPYFLPVLQTLLQEISFDPPPSGAAPKSAP